MFFFRHKQTAKTLQTAWADPRGKLLTKLVVTKPQSPLFKSSTVETNVRSWYLLTIVVLDHKVYLDLNVKRFLSGTAPTSWFFLAFPLRAKLPLIKRRLSSSFFLNIQLIL